MSIMSAARGVTQVMNRCEDAKTSGFLDLSDCQLMYIADAIYLVLKDYEIQRCSLKNNTIKNFPKKLIQKFPNMTVMNLEGNQLAEVPSEICEWSQLKGLSLARNRLCQFPEELFALKQISLLDISHNAIQEIDIRKICGEMTSLKQINLSGNPFTQSTQDHILQSISHLSNQCAIKF